jgi:hypothetical protein
LRPCRSSRTPSTSAAWRSFFDLAAIEQAFLRSDDGLELGLRFFGILTNVLVGMEDESKAAEGSLYILGSTAGLKA